MGNIYSRAELKHLIQIHVENPAHQEESGLTQEDHQLLSGALDYKVHRLLPSSHLSPRWECVSVPPAHGALALRTRVCSVLLCLHTLR